jgi:hypothetical protein
MTIQVGTLRIHRQRAATDFHVFFYLYLNSKKGPTDFRRNCLLSSILDLRTARPRTSMIHRELRLDTVKQDVRFTDNHLGRSAEVIVAVSCS